MVAEQWSIAEGTGLLQEEVPHQFGIHGVLEEKDHKMARIHEEVSARMPHQDGEPYELTRFVMRGDMTGLVYDAPVE